VNEKRYTLDHTRKILCKSELSLQSMVMGQVLLLLILLEVVSSKVIS